MDLLSLFKVVFVSWALSLSSITISSCATWDTNDLTIAENGRQSKDVNQLNYPQEILIHKKLKRCI